MKHQELKETWNKKKLFELCFAILAIPSTLMKVLCIAAYLSGEASNERFLFIASCVSGVVLGLSLCFVFLEEWKRKNAQSYFEDKVTDIIVNYGIHWSMFEMIRTWNSNYIVVVYDQTIDNNHLQNLINYDVKAMNRIMRKNIEVRIV